MHFTRFHDNAHINNLLSDLGKCLLQWWNPQQRKKK